MEAEGGDAMAARKSSRVNRKYKTKYRVRNWREYERGLRSRCDITIWLSDEAIAVLRSCLEGGTKLPAPDLGFLREHRDVALAAAKQLITSDRRVEDEEREIFAQLKELLGG